MLDTKVKGDELPMKLCESEVIRLGDLVWSQAYMTLWVHKPHQVTQYRSLAFNGVHQLRIISTLIECGDACIGIKDLVRICYVSDSCATKLQIGSVRTMVGRVNLELKNHQSACKILGGGRDWDIPKGSYSLRSIA